MAPKIYDAVVVGGGHHGLVVACYLQKAGLKTAIFEKRRKVGGPVVTEAGPADGFMMNSFCQGGAFVNHPAYADFRLSEKGLKFVYPEQRQAIIFDNDTCVTTYPAFRVVQDKKK